MRSVEPVTGVEDDGFVRFFDREYHAIVGLAYVLCGRLDDAEDLAQDAFAAAFRDWDRIRRYDNPGAWIRRVVANRAVSLRRHRLVQARALQQLAGRRTITDAEIPVADTELWAAVRSLPRRQAQVIALVYLEDRSVQQAAEILGCTEETTRTHLRRGRASVARRLGLNQPEGDQ
jgi:RNA polymerase sigma factor (sigma-70 family)